MQIFTKKRPLTSSWDLIAPSTRLLQQYFWQTMYLSFLPALLMTVAIVMLSDGEQLASGPRAAAGVTILFIATIWSALTSAAFIYLQAAAVNGEDISSLEAFKKGLPRIIPLFLSTILAVFLILLGIIAFILPGIILLRGFYLSPFYVVVKNMGPLEALKQSYHDSLPVTGYIWGTISVQFFFSLLGSLLVAIPVVGYLLNLAVRYFYIYAPALRYAEVADHKNIMNKNQDDRT